MSISAESEAAAHSSSSVEGGPTSPASRSDGRGALLLGGTVVGLVLALGVASTLPAPRPSTKPPAAKSRVFRVGPGPSALPLKTSARLAAPDDVGAWIEVPGRVKAHLAPSSIARIVAVGERATFALEGGAIAAQVSGPPGVEALAVDVLGKRVATQGGRLEIALERGRGGFEVAVAEGSAVVGPPRGYGRTEGVVVVAGTLARFSGDAPPSMLRAPDVVALRLADSLRPPPEPSASRDGAGKGAAATFGSSVVSPAPSENGMADADVIAVLAKVDAALKRCSPPRGSVETMMTYEVEADGEIEELFFEPPLDPPLEKCVKKVLEHLDFPASKRGTSMVTRPVVFGRK